MPTRNRRGVKVKFFPKAVEREARAKMVPLLRVAVEMVRARVVENISVPTRTAGPSVPGEFPHADTGKLRQSIFGDVNAAALTGIVGTPLTYGRYHEMHERPFLTTSLYEMQPAIRRLMKRGRP